MELWSVFLLGLLGSVHCAGMCGPLAMAVPWRGGSKASLAASRAAYNAGRVFTYCLLGVVFGLAGRMLAWAGFQRWLSLGAGIAILLGFMASTRLALHTPAARVVTRLKSAFAGLLRRRSLGSTFLLGGLNGLLPCGLVYVAAAGAVARGGVAGGAEHMLAFGLGTVPMMFAMGMAGSVVRKLPWFKLQRLTPVWVLLLAGLLILRGLPPGGLGGFRGVEENTPLCPACLTGNRL